MRKWLLIGWMLCALGGFAQNHWTPNAHQFPTNMNVIAILEINGIEQNNTYLELGVFCGSDCRGSSMLHYYASPVDRYMLFLTAYGNNDDPFTFRLYDHLTEQELDLVSNNQMAYQVNGIIGMTSNPYVFSFTGGNCRVNAMADPAMIGEVTGGGNYPCGTYCTVNAVPVDGSIFLGWTMNGDTLTKEPSFSFNVVADIELTAHFYDYEEVSELSTAMVPYPNPTQGKVWLKGAPESLQAPVAVYDIHGNQVFTSTANPMDLSGLKEGVYFVKIQGKTVRKLVLCR